MKTHVVVVVLVACLLLVFITVSQSWRQAAEGKDERRKWFRRVARFKASGLAGGQLCSRWGRQHCWDSGVRRRRRR
ncbi:hypothetical protein V1264_024300 [Littorina saxatilis]|uniref:Uncharacterized protein n=1 Tax=Littorina saxatilis TaxID=31220 RepID=A0AAN9AMB0_9CAEN